MQKITPHLWFEKGANEAATMYASLFPNSKVESVNTIPGTPSGDTEIVSFNLSGIAFMAIGAGPMYKLNPSISMFAVFDDVKKIEEVWKKLIVGGKELMPFQTYPWASKYGWLQDKYGLSWQLSMSENHKFKQAITPMLMYTGEVAGKANEAIKTYTEIFPDSKVELLTPYEKNDGDKEGFLKHARFSLNGSDFMAMDSSHPHQFGFNEAISFIVTCETQEEIDYYWSRMSAVPEAEQCGWLKDKFGVSWQIVPTAMNKMMSNGTPEQIGKVTQAFLKMKKFNIAELERAFLSWSSPVPQGYPGRAMRFARVPANRLGTITITPSGQF